MSPEMTMLLNNKEDGYRYRERRHEEWTENYTLHRDRVLTNRLTQRQTANVPLMKQTVSTMMKDIDDMPVLYFQNIDNNKEAEAFKNMVWERTSDLSHFELNDFVDKKQVLLFGRSFDQWQIIDGMVTQTIVDTMDILVSRFTNPVDINTSRYLIHTHIYVPLTKIEANEDYDTEATNNLKNWYGTEMGLKKIASNHKLHQDKMEKMRDMGLQDVDSPILGETIVELTLHFVRRKEEGDEEEQIYLYVEADDREILMKKPLEEVIGETKDNFWRTHFPYETWAGDLEIQDFWSDGVGDIIRPTNKILNAWISQMVENRTLRNLNMQVYDATANNGEFNPGTFNPIAWGWYGVPGKPSDVYQQMQVADLSESIDEIKLMLEISEKATGATAGQQGAPAQRQITLGEFKATLNEAKERVQGLSKFYTLAWKRRGTLFLRMIEAGFNSGKLDSMTIQKEGTNTNDLYEREVSPKDYMTKSGYLCKVWSQADKNDHDIETLQKMNLAKQAMPMNKKLDEIYKRKLLELTDALTPQETNDIIEEEKAMREQLAQGAQAGIGVGQASNPALASGAPIAPPNQPPIA